MKTVTDMFEPYIGTKEYNGIVRTMIEWYYGHFAKVAWCAVSMSYMMNKLGILDQIGGKNQNVYEMMMDTEKAWKKTKVGQFYWRDEIPKGMYIPRGTIVFNLYSSKPMTASSSKHVTSVYAGFKWTTSGKWQSLGGNQSDYIKVKEYNRGNIYAIFIPDYDQENDKHKTLRKGDKGDEVTELQMALNQLGYPDDDYKALSIDGSFGAKTEQAVKRLQSHNGLVVDGVCGPKTWAVIKHLQDDEPTLVQTLTDVYLRSKPDKTSESKGILRKGATAIYSFAEKGWLYLPRWNAWITSKKEFVKIV